MPNKIGIFMYVNSIGWTLINQETKDIVAMGTHVFSLGSENFGMGRREMSKKFNKRIFRLRRVRYTRIRVRKIHLLKILIENKMCPLSLDELNSWSANKVVPETNFDEWMRLDPYELRSKAVYGQISLHELGRILYQISSHQGYRFGERNSKLVESVLKEGSPEEGKVGFAEMRRVTREETLGEYLHSIKPIEAKSYTKSNTRIRNRVCRGMLHKEILFGKRTVPRMNSGFHVRKSLLSFKTLNQVDKIVDPIIRGIVKAAVEKTVTGGSQISFSAFFKIASDGSLIPKLHLPNTKGGDPVPIKKVRIREVYTTDVNIKKGLNQHVIPRNNHHVLIYKDQEEVFHEQVITFWQAIKRKKADEAVVQLPDPEKDTFVTTLRINDMFLMGTENLEDDLNLESRSYLKNHLYRIQKLSSKFYEFRFAYKQASPSTDAPEYNRVNNFGERKTGWNTYNPVKVEVDVVGQIKRKIEKI